jgi:hypothetical protein
VRLWDAATGGRVGPPLPTRRTIYALRFSPDGRTLAAASEDRTARLWEVPRARPDDGIDPDRLVETLTGSTLDDEGNPRPLVDVAWSERFRQTASPGTMPLLAEDETATPDLPAPLGDQTRDREAALRALIRGDRDRYRNLCRMMLNCYDWSPHWTEAERLAKLCLIDPRELELHGRAAEIADRCLRESDGSPWALLLKGLARLRKADLNEAIRAARMARVGGYDFNEPGRTLLPALSHAIEALVLARSDRRDEARRALDEARRLLESKYPGACSRPLDPDAPFSLNLVLYFLKEAEAGSSPTLPAPSR